MVFITLQNYFAYSESCQSGWWVIWGMPLYHAQTKLGLPYVYQVGLEHSSEESSDFRVGALVHLTHKISLKLID